MGDLVKKYLTWENSGQASVASQVMCSRESLPQTCHQLITFTTIPSATVMLLGCEQALMCLMSMDLMWKGREMSQLKCSFSKTGFCDFSRSLQINEEK